ncbi:hypothetical protein DFQ30_008286 [Apophysomyces sp. BC1015]|nr:hypothetical protein DFQ30_008286 [Apophysomyces sp. BC1015]
MAVTDTTITRQEQMQLLETCLYGLNNGPSVLSIFKNPKTPRVFKQAMTKVVSGLACSSSLRHILGWLFENLCQCPNENTDIVENSRDREIKTWLLRTLRQILMDATTDPVSIHELREVSSSVINSLIMFLDAMDSSEYIPDILSVLDVLTETCADAFSTRFQAYKKLQPFWRHKLPFAFELLHHFLSDMRGIVGDMLSNGVEQKPAPQSNQKWEISNKVIIRLISIKRYTFRQYQWKIYQYFVRQIPEDIELSDAMRFIETLMKMVDTWDKNTDDALIHALLAPDSSPLHRFRREHRENKQLSSSIFVFLRVIARLCKSNDTMANVARELSKQLGNNVAIMTAAYDVCADTPTLRRMTTVLSVNQVSMADFNVISVQPAQSVTRPHVTIAVVDSIFYSYLLLDMAALCLEIKKTVLLIVLQNDPSLIELDELALLGCLLEDMTDVWANVNLRSRQVLCSLTDTILNVFKFENNTKAVTLPLRSIIVGILKATDDERNNDVRESMIRLICRYCQKFDMVDIMDLVLRQAKKGIKDPCLIIQDASMELLSVLNPFMICEARVPPDAVTLLLQRNIMATPHTGSFRPIHYEIVMRHLGMSDHLIGPSAESPQLSTAENVRNPLEWAQRLFHQCDTVRNMKTASILENTEEGLAYFEIC